MREPAEVFPVLPLDEAKSVLADLLRRKDSEAREMAIKERLLKQLNIVRDGLNAMPPFYSRDLRAIHNALVQARDLFFRRSFEDLLQFIL